MKHYLLPIALTALLTACDSTSSDKTEASGQAVSIEELEKGVFATHDEVMPRIGDIMKLKKELNGKLSALDSLQGSPGEVVRVDEQKAQAQLLVRRLTEADSLMMDWMHRYNSDTLKVLSEAEAARYLGDQQQRINDVKSKINQSIADAQTYLKQ
jgi:hypothetical protein